MRTRLVWFLLGVLAAGLTAYASIRHGSQPPLSSEQRRVLTEHGFEPITIVEEIVTEVPVEVPVKQKVVVRVPGEPVEVIRTERVEIPVEVPGECPIPKVELGGGCQIDVVGDMARGLWDCTATGPGWTATRGPVVASEMRFEVAEQAQEPRWRRDLWLGPWKAEDGYGAILGASVQGRKWGLMAGVSILPHEDERVLLSDNEPVGFGDSLGLETGAGLLFSRRW